jgi:hypothetical protein
MWHGHFASSIMLTFVLTHRSHLSKRTQEKTFLHPRYPHYNWQPKTNLVIVKWQPKKVNPILQRLKFDHQFSNDLIFLVAILVAIENFWLPILWHLKAFHHQYWSDGKLSIVNCMVTNFFFWYPNLWILIV